MLTPMGINLRSSLLWHSFVPFSQYAIGGKPEFCKNRPDICQSLISLVTARSEVGRKKCKSLPVLGTMEDTFLISTPFKSVKVHPLVPLTILEFYNRRQENQEVIVGRPRCCCSHAV